MIHFIQSIKEYTPGKNEEQNIGKNHVICSERGIYMDFEKLRDLLINAGGNIQPGDIVSEKMMSRLKKLGKPSKIADVVIDTDAFNEIDDQFAIAYALKLTDVINVQAFYAAPFINWHAESPKTGMEKSFDEIHHILGLAGCEKYRDLTFHGSDRFLPDEHTPVDSPAVDDLISRGMSRDPDNPLYVVAIAAITNIASALLKEPRLVDRLVVIWHGGTALDWPICNSFNACQDIAATRVVMGSGVPFVMQPGHGVTSKLGTTGPELDYWLKGKNVLCDYLVNRMKEEARLWKLPEVWSHPLFDVAALSWFLQDKRYMDECLRPTPLISYDLHYEFDSRRHLMRYVYDVNRDQILTDLFRRISN